MSTVPTHLHKLRLVIMISYLYTLPWQKYLLKVGLFDWSRGHQMEPTTDDLFLRKQSMFTVKVESEKNVVLIGWAWRFSWRKIAIVCQSIRLRSSVIGSIWCLQNQSNTCRSQTFVKGLCRDTISLFHNLWRWFQLNYQKMHAVPYTDYEGRWIRVILLPLVCLVMGDKMLVRLLSREISNKHPLRSLGTAEGSSELFWSKFVCCPSSSLSLLSLSLSLTFHIFIFSSRTSGPISTKLGTKHPWVKGIQVCSDEGLCPFPRGDIYKLQKYIDKFK